MKISLGSIQRKGRCLYLVLRKNGRQQWLSLKTGDYAVAKQRARSLLAPTEDEADWLAHLAAVGKRAELQLRHLKLSAWLTWDCLFDVFISQSAVPVPEPSRASYARWLKILESCANGIPPQTLNRDDALRIVSTLAARYASFRRMVIFFRRCWKTVGLDATIWRAVPGLDGEAVCGIGAEFFRRLSLGEVRRIYGHLQEKSPELADMVAVGYTTGLRLSDVAELDTSEISDDGMSLRVVPNKTKARKRRPLAIPLAHEAAEAVKRRLLEAKRGTPQGEKSFLFSSWARNRPSRKIAAAFRACGIRKVGKARASFHSLRATFISLMDEAGVSPHLTDAITGHGGGGMHARYTQPSMAAMRTAILTAIPPLTPKASPSSLEGRARGEAKAAESAEDGSDGLSGPVVNGTRAGPEDESTERRGNKLTTRSGLERWRPGGRRSERKRRVSGKGQTNPTPQKERTKKMKKLMIVAALAATAGAYADPGACIPEEKENVARVYQVKMTVKTTKGTTDTADKSSTCNPESEGVLRVKDSTKFEGWIYDCDVCNAVESGTVAMWDSKRKAPFKSAAFETTFLNVIGKSKKDAEWAWVFGGTVTYGKDNAVEQTYTLTGAGYGKYDKKNEFYKSFSGYFAGTATASYDLKSENCDPSQVWKCDDLDTLTDSDDTVAFGTWSVKYSKSASKKYQKGGVNSLKHPSYYSFAE